MRKIGKFIATSILLAPLVVLGYDASRVAAKAEAERKKAETTLELRDYPSDFWEAYKFEWLQRAKIVDWAWTDINDVRKEIERDASAEFIEKLNAIESGDVAVVPQLLEIIRTKHGFYFSDGIVKSAMDALNRADPVNMKRYLYELTAANTQAVERLREIDPDRAADAIIRRKGSGKLYENDALGNILIKTGSRTALRALIERREARGLAAFVHYHEGKPVVINYKYSILPILVDDIRYCGSREQARNTASAIRKLDKGEAVALTYTSYVCDGNHPILDGEYRLKKSIAIDALLGR